MQEYLNEPLKVIEFKRKNELRVLQKPTKLKNLDKKTELSLFLEEMF